MLGRRFHSKRVAILLIIAAVLLGAFVWLGEIIGKGPVPIDLGANSWAASIQTPIGISVSKIISFIFSPSVIIVVSLFASLYLFFKGFKKEAFLFASVMLLDGLLSIMTKDLFQRSRPPNMLLTELDPSFPSGHAMISVVLFSMIIYLAYKHLKNKRLRLGIIVISLLMISIIGFSRLYLNVHWVTDVIGGYLLGLFVVCICFAGYRFLVENDN